MSAETSAQPKPDQQATPSETTDYSLSEVRIAAMADLAPKLKEAELRLILELSRRQLTSPGAVRASGRELANACKMGRRNVQYALDALAKRNLITLRQGTATTAAIYRVNIFDTVPMGGVVTTPPPPTQGWLGGVEATPPLASLRRHPGDVTTPPPTENTALAAAAASLDLDEASLRLIDRVYSSKLQDHHPDDLAAIQQRLYGYFRKFGRGDDGRPIANPHPPDPHVAATLLAIAELNRLETMLDNLELDAMATKAYLPSTKSSLNPYSYGWFSIIALSRIHGIHFHKTKKARAALRDVKRKPRQPQPEQIDLPDIAALAKQKAMR